MEIKAVWKAIKVAVGKERQVTEALAELGIESYLPMVTIIERRRGEWEERQRALLEGYLLIHVNWTAELYYTLKNMWYVQCPLAGSVEEAEIAYLKQYEAMACQSAIDYTSERVTYRGPIASAPERIIKVDKRKGRALVRFELGPENVMKRWLPVKIIR